MDGFQAHLIGSNVKTIFIFLIKCFKLISISEYIYETSRFLFNLPLSNASSICKVVSFGRTIMAFPDPSIFWPKQTLYGHLPYVKSQLRKMIATEYRICRCTIKQIDIFIVLNDSHLHLYWQLQVSNTIKKYNYKPKMGSRYLNNNIFLRNIVIQG